MSSEKQSENFIILRDRVIQCIDREIKIFERLKEHIHDSDINGEMSNTSLSNPLAEIEDLREEQKKLENLEVIIAVIGTMKAGKSTTINAIIGSEVLPNRNQPMTTLPTLIRHQHALHLPVLTFNASDNMNKLMDELRQRIQNNDSTIAELRSREEYTEIIQNIEKNQWDIYKNSEQTESIFSFLKDLNDLVRLAQECQLPFPFEDYRKIETLPSIEIAFQHLSHLSAESHDIKGKLTLVDTPGPNEVRLSHHLRQVLREQLKKASAILVVMDYTQFSSEATHSIAEELDQIKNIFEDGRLYAVVNKFDQKNTNGMEIKDVEAYVKQIIGEQYVEGIYPISASYAVVANRAARTLEEQGKLPDYQTAGWVKDFAEKAFGVDWQEDFEEANNEPDQKTLRKKIQKITDKSLFLPFIEEVIAASYQRSAQMSLESALAKITDKINKLKNFATIRQNSLKKTIEELNEIIQHIQVRIGDINQNKHVIEDHLDNEIKVLRNCLEQITKGVQSQIQNLIAEYFKEGRRLELDPQQRSTIWLKKKWEQIKSTTLDSLVNVKDRFKFAKNPDFDPSQKVKTFQTRSEAEFFLGHIENAVETIRKTTQDNAHRIITETMNTFCNEFLQKQEEDAYLFLQAFQDQLSKKGLNLTLSLPKLGMFDFEDLSIDINLDVVIYQRQEEGTEDPKGVFERMLELVSKWFRTEAPTQNVYFEIDLDRVQEEYNKAIEVFTYGMNQQIIDILNQQLKTKINVFYQEFLVLIEEIKGDFHASLLDKQKTKEEQEALAIFLAEVLTYCETQLNFLHDLRTDILHIKENPQASLSDPITEAAASFGDQAHHYHDFDDDDASIPVITETSNL